MLKKLVKNSAKFPGTTPGRSMVKIAHLNDAFLEAFLTASKPSRSSITAAKTREREKKERGKNFKNREALRRRSLSRPKAYQTYRKTEFDALLQKHTQ